MGKRKGRYTVYPASYQAGLVIDGRSDLAVFLQSGFSSSVWWIHVRLKRYLRLELVDGGRQMQVASNCVYVLWSVRNDMAGKFSFIRDREDRSKVEALIIPARIGHYVQEHIKLFPGDPCQYRVGIQNCVGKDLRMIKGVIDKIDELVNESAFSHLQGPDST